MVALVGGDDELGVGGVDAVGRQALEEGGEGGVVGLRLGDVARVTRAEGRRGEWAQAGMVLLLLPWMSAM